MASRQPEGIAEKNADKTCVPGLRLIFSGAWRLSYRIVDGALQIPILFSFVN